MVPTRADRCCYVLHSDSSKRAQDKNTASDDSVSRKRAEAARLVKSYEKVAAKQRLNMDLLDKAIDLLTDPIYGSPSKTSMYAAFYAYMLTTSSWPATLSF